jgi:NAD(P)-dependent dehydrogenase (short-subunit alcohol dehydrogenase family)
MTFDLNNPAAGYRVAVFGSGGGIGSALVRDLARRPGVAEVLAFSRSERPVKSSRIDFRTVNVLSDESLAEVAANTVPGLDLVIVATGTLHADHYTPERRISEVTADAMTEIFQINTVAPALIAKHFLPLLARNEPTVFAALTARVGSISDNRLGGWTSYRASKAALNMVLKTFAIEHARRRKQSLVVGLHPGTVDTRLSRPFSGNVPNGKLFSPAQSAGYLLNVIQSLEPDHNGRVLAWDGNLIDY